MNPRKRKQSLTNVATLPQPNTKARIATSPTKSVKTNPSTSAIASTSSSSVIKPSSSGKSPQTTFDGSKYLMEIWGGLVDELQVWAKTRPSEQGENMFWALVYKTQENKLHLAKETFEKKLLKVPPLPPEVVAAIDFAKSILQDSNGASALLSRPGSYLDEDEDEETEEEAVDGSEGGSAAKKHITMKKKRSRAGVAIVGTRDWEIVKQEIELKRLPVYANKCKRCTSRGTDCRMNPGTPVCLPCLDAHVRCHHPDPDCADLEQSLERLKWPHSREEIDLLLETTIESAAEQLATSRSTTSGEQVLNRYSQLAVHDAAAPKASTSLSRTKALSTIPVTTSTSRTQTKGTPSSSSRQLATTSASSAQASTSTSASASTSSIHAHTNGYVPPPPPPYLTKDTPLMTSLPPSPSSSTVKLTAPVPPLTSVSPRNNQLSRSATFPTSLSNPVPQIGPSSGLPGRSQNMTLPTKPALYTSSWSRNSIRKSVSFAFSEGDVTESDEDEEEEIERGLLPEEDHEPHSPSPYTLSSISSASRYSIPYNRPSSPPWQLKPSVTDVVGAIETLSSSLQQTKAKFELASKTILTQDRKIKALEEEVIRLRTAADTRGDEKSLNSSVWKSTFDIPTVGANPQPRTLNRNMVNGHSGGGDSGEAEERDGRLYEDVGIQAYDELDV